MNSPKKGPEIVYLTLLLFGALGNMFLLYLHSQKLIISHRKRLISLIIVNLALTHTLMIFFRGMPIIIITWGWRSFPDDMMGKILNYFITVTRGVSLTTTCLLSVFQAITISPNSPIWTEIKTWIHKHILSCSLFCWIFNILVDVIMVANISDARNSSNERWRVGHSSFNLHTGNTIKILIWKSVIHALFVGFMICSSGYMVSVLYRHRRQVQHIHTSLLLRASHETRATKAILMLVLSFVCFNSASSPFVIYIASVKATGHWGLRFTVALSLFYPIVSPFMLISFDTQMPRFLHVLLGLKKLGQKNSQVNENTWVS